ncbi:hypothetical protein A9R01_12465 ['Osedax' symbiont bacterium Rs2_46_30_T18]|nr:hypothetical protein A9R01_12465 ['Osedax' symbiont bacterium Rs2_46_30_T18]
MQQINKVIQCLIIALNSAFIGAMLIIALVIVPFWQTTQASDFLDWFSLYSPTIGKLMIPFGPGVLMLTVIVFFIDGTNKKLWGLTIGFLLANVLYFPIYFLPTNASFAEQTIAINDVSTELSTWLGFHWHRIFFALAALITSILAVVKIQPRIRTTQQAKGISVQ